MLDQTRDPSTPEVAAASGSSILVGHSGLEDHRKLVRRQLACGAIFASSLVWIYALVNHAEGYGAISWSMTLGAVAFGAVAAAGRKSLPLTLRHGLLQMVDAGERRPLTFVEAYALTYLGLSLALCGWIVYHMLAGPPPPVLRTQVVDIELTRLADYKNRQALLPSTEDKPTLRKRSSPDPQTLQGEITARSAPKPAQHGESPKQVRVKSDLSAQPADRTVLAQEVVGAKSSIATPPRKNDSPLVADAQSGQKFRVYEPPRMVASQPQEGSKNAANDEVFMEEVAPPELVELVDNDGDAGLDVWQAGGRSSGGKGAPSELSVYLKELNRRIKRAWSPPRGITRRAEILFRIRREGTLAMIKIVRSSGDPEADTAAIRSITACSPFRQLPSDYALSYLDIKYAFNYTADELTELSDGRPQ